jgi:hypothetical protein
MQDVHLDVRTQVQLCIVCTSLTAGAEAQGGGISVSLSIEKLTGLLP